MKLLKAMLIAGIILNLHIADVWAAQESISVKKTDNPVMVAAQYKFEVSNLGNDGQLMEQYKLSKYDVINLLVIGFPNGIGVNDIMVGPDGYVQIPYVGVVKLAGLTLEEAKILLMTRLGEYIRIPDMSLIVKSYGPRKVYVMGEVRNPGIIEMPIDSMNVYAAISKCAGIATHGRPKHVQVIRVVNDTMYYQEVNLDDFIKKHDISQNLSLKDGDIVYVPKSNKIDLKEDILPYVSVYGIYKSLTE